MSVTSPQVKICGITNREDALMAAKLGADYLGYILNYPSSPRFVEPSRAKGIIQEIRREYPRVQHVGVVVDADAHSINQLVTGLGLQVVQLHGNEPLDTVQAIQGAEVWKAVELRNASGLQAIAKYRDVADGILLDSGKGTGKSISDHLLSNVKLRTKFILAGGITPDNVTRIVNAYDPDVVDVNSGVESAPGKKDAALVMRIFLALETV